MMFEANNLLTCARNLAWQLEESASVIRELCDALENARDKTPAAGILSESVRGLGLSVRSRNALQRLGIDTVGELVKKTPDELLEARFFGITCLNEVREKLAGIGLKLRNDLEGTT